MILRVLVGLSVLMLLYATGIAMEGVKSVAGQVTWMITASAGPGGSIDPSGDVIVLDGDDRDFAIEPDNGYEIIDVVVDGDSVGAVSSYSFKNVGEDHSIAAAFVQGLYTIDASVSGIGGAISPSGSVAVDGGDNVTFTMIPDAGFHVLNVRVDGGYVGPQGSFTFYEVSENHDIVAFFAADVYFLTLELVGPGWITPDPNQISYSYGDIVTLTATPMKSGFVFAYWSGSLSGSVNPATLFMDGNKTVTATFSRNQVYLLLDAEPRADYVGGQEVSFTVSVLNQRNPRLEATLTLTVTGPGGYGFYDFLPVMVSANGVSDYGFSWVVPNVDGRYVVEASLVPAQLTAYDAKWLTVDGSSVGSGDAGASSYAITESAVTAVFALFALCIGQTLQVLGGLCIPLLLTYEARSLRNFLRWISVPSAPSGLTENDSSWLKVD